MMIIVYAYCILILLLVQYMLIASQGAMPIAYAMLIAMPVAAILPLACVIHAIYGDNL